MAAVPQQILEDIRQALRDLRTPTKLGQSSFISSHLVARHLRGAPELPPHQALKKELSEILQQLEADNPDFAELLRGRFWEGCTVDKMLADDRPRPMSSSNFYVLQREAIEHFAYLFWEKEQIWQRASQEEAPPAPIKEEALVDARPAPLDSTEDISPAAAMDARLYVSEQGTPQRSRWAPRPRTVLFLTIAAIIIAVATIGSVEQRSAAQSAMPLQQITDIAGMSRSAVASSVAQTVSPDLSTNTTNVTPTQPVSVCGETSRSATPNKPRFLRHQGVSAFTVDNTDGLVLLDRVRAVTLDKRGLWIGYFSTSPAKSSGLGHYDKQTWANCNQPGGVNGTNINALVFDQVGRLWVGNEKAGVAMLDDKGWHTYTISDGLPSNEIFGLAIDAQDNVWAGTWEGVAKFDGKRWSVPYTANNNTLFNNHVHAIAFDSTGNIWVGHINSGVSQYRNADGQWIWHTMRTNSIGGDEIRSIVVRKGDAGAPESVWFATFDGGVSKYEQGAWTVYHVEDGLPSNEVWALAIDRYNRVWAATSKGVAYFDSNKWVIYDTLDTLSIAFSSGCQNCPFDDDHVWTGTTTMGLTHSRIPLPDKVIDVVDVCFNSVGRQRICPYLSAQKSATVVTTTDAITITYPVILTPGEQFRPEIVIAPRAPYQFREDRGDFLSNTAGSNDDLYGAYEHIAVRGTIEPGQPYTFTDFDNLLKAPQLAPEEREKTFISTWRMWMHTRYVGPRINLLFTVRRP